MIPVGPLIRVVHGLLVHVGLHSPSVALIRAIDDDYPVPTPSHPSHAPDVREGSSNRGSGTCHNAVTREQEPKLGRYWRLIRGKFK